MPLSHTLRGIQAPILPLLPEHPVPSQPSAMPNGIIMLGPKVPGTRCPTCALDGKEIANYKTNKKTRVTCFKETALFGMTEPANPFSFLIEIYAFSISQWEYRQTPLLAPFFSF
ncbi:hypothetical protein GGI35DRAFT_475371 [Trichoderma velutinum]